MHTLKDIYSFNKKRGHVGIEIEVEAEDYLPIVEDKFWTSKKETSLRYYGMEYITNGPIVVDEDKVKAIRIVTDAIKESKFKVIEDSPRTSVHVHANVQTFTPTQVWTAATAYWLLEDALMEYCGKDRIGNKFCLRLRDASALLRTCVNDLKKTQPFRSMHMNHVKYAGLNLAAVNQFGSLEFRGMRGTLDHNVIDNWSTAVYKLVENATKHFKSPAELMDYYYKHGAYQLKSLLIHPCLSSKLKVKEDEVEDMAGLLCPLAYNHNWSDWEKTLEKVTKDDPPSKPSYYQSSISLSAGSINTIPQPVPMYIPVDWTEVWAGAYQRSEWHSSPAGTKHMKYNILQISMNSDWHTTAFTYANSKWTVKYTPRWYDSYIYMYRREYLKSQQGNQDGYEDQSVQ